MSPPSRKARGLLTSYRIVTRRFAGTAFSGEGARRYGGRWNSLGVPIVYTSSTIALALLEWRAHLSQWPPPKVLIIDLQFDPSIVLEPSRLPQHWNQHPAPKANASVGDTWVRAGKSAILKLPSAIVPEEYNYLLNPAHPDFAKILRGKPRLLKVDPRLGPLATS
jgi:RES domain-containing protein